MADLYESIAVLQAACANPRRQLEHYLEQGKQAVGCFAPYTPEELVHACGMIPMGLWGGQTELKLVKSWLPAFACPIMQANLELGLRGAYEGLSAVIIPALCDTLRCMTQNWRFGVPSIPMIPVVYPQNRTSPAAVDYLISEYESILVSLYTLTGRMMSEKALLHTIDVYNAHSRAMREFSDAAARHLDIITPTVRHAVMKSAYFFEKSEHTAIVSSITDALNALPDADYSGWKIILTGISSEPEDLLRALEEHRIAVIADDLVHGSGQYDTDIPARGGGGLKRLALQWIRREASSLIHETGKPRGARLAKLCRAAGADGVINCLMKFCDPEEYDKPWLEQDLRTAGYPCLTVETDPLSVSCEQLRTRIQSFGEILEQSRSL